MANQDLNGAQALPKPAKPMGLITVCAGEDGLPQADMAVSLAREAARIGQSVLLIDCHDGASAAALGITPAITLQDVLSDRAPLRGAKYITPCGDIAVCAGGAADLADLLGPITALSLSYDCVIVNTPPGCTPAHVELAAAADSAAMLFHHAGDRFMRAYWMLDAIRARAPRFDPYMVGIGSRADVFETYDLFAGTVRDFLGGPPPLGGAVDADAADAQTHRQASARYICESLTRSSSVALSA